MTVDITVAIPTFNGEKRLPALLEALRSQGNLDGIIWEVIVVDNNSQDGTAALIQSYQSQSSHPFLLRYCFEAQQGIAFARQRAVEEAQGVVVGFLDDDNIPAANWIRSVYQFAQQYPRAGAFNGKIQGVFQQPPPEELKNILFYLALVDRGDQPLQYQPRKNGVPPGAGLVVRRQVWLNFVPRDLLFLGRLDGSLVAADDAEALIYIHQGGWEIWYNPQLQIEHHIDAKRLELAYFKQLTRGVGLTRHYLRMLLLKPWQRPFFFLIYLLKDTYQIIRHYLKYRTVLASDAYASCEMERFIGTLISPIFIWRLRLKQLLKNLSQSPRTLNAEAASLKTGL